LETAWVVNMFSVFTLAIASIIGCVVSSPLPDPCCPRKTVGKFSYSLLGHDEVTASFGCKNDCVYERDDQQGSRYCFQDGGILIPACEGPPLRCYQYTDEEFQEFLNDGETLTHATCDDQQIDTCTGSECGNLTINNCIIRQEDLNATNLADICQWAHEDTGVIDKKRCCFAMDVKVMLKSGKEKLMKDLNIGEEVMSDDQGGVTKFLGWLDKHSDWKRYFLKITTNGGDQLTLTGNHIVFYFNNNASTSTYAEDLVPGDVLVGKNGEGKIIHSIETVVMTASLSPLTKSGTIMANNIYSSCYGSYPHQLANLAMLPARLFPRIFLDDEETLHREGVRPFVATVKMIGSALGFRFEREDGNMKDGEVLFVGINAVVFAAWSKKMIHL